MIQSKIFSEEGGVCLIDDMSITTNVWERMQGLIGKPQLAPNQGLMLSSCNSVHTFGMKYDLDVIFLNKNKKIVKLVERLKPMRVSFCLNAVDTLELNSGVIKSLELNLNDYVYW